VSKDWQPCRVQKFFPNDNEVWFRVNHSLRVPSSPPSIAQLEIHNKDDADNEYNDKNDDTDGEREPTDSDHDHDHDHDDTVYDGGGAEEVDENQLKPFSTSDAATRHQHRDGHTEIRRPPTTIAEMFSSFAQLEVHDKDNDEDDNEDNDEDDNEDNDEDDDEDNDEDDDEDNDEDDDEDNDEDDDEDNDEDNDDEDDDIGGVGSKLTEEEWRQRACDTLYGAWSHRCGCGDSSPACTTSHVL
jgi:hypothetical protein